MDLETTCKESNAEEHFGVANPDASELGAYEHSQTLGSQLDPAMLESITYISNTDLQEIELDALLRKTLEADGSLKFIKCLAEKGANLNLFDPDSKDSLLIMSVKKNRVDVVKFLLSKGANTAWRNSDEYDALHTAVYLGNLELVEALIVGGASVESWNGVRSPLHTAAQLSHLDVLKLLINEGGDLTREDVNGETVICLIRRLQQEVSLKAYLKNRELERSYEYEDAIRQNNIKYITNYIVQDGDVHLRGTYKHPGGRSGLHTAVAVQNGELVRLFLYAKANPNLQNDDAWTPVREAMQKNADDILNLLAAAGANFNGCTFEKQKMLRTYLTQAVEWNSIKLAQSLISHGADVNGRDRDGYSALHVAVQKQNVDMVKSLIQLGAKLEAQDPNGSTPLYFAIRIRNVELVRTLLDAGARTDKLKNFQYAVELAKAIEDAEFLCALLTVKKAK